VVGINGRWPWSTTGTNMAISPFRVSIFPSLLTTEAERD
jgi:hypothetical protein